MTTRIKTLFIDKILPKHSLINTLSGNFINTHVIYKHKDNHYTIDLTNINNETKELNQSKEELTERIQFNVEKEIFVKHILEGIHSKEPIHGHLTPKKVVIDFSSPNIAKPFHVGHLRSTIIGNFASNINKYYSNTVKKINYLGDWGTQFGLLQYGLKAKGINLNDLKNQPMKQLYEAYVYANKLAMVDDNVQVEARKYFSDIEHGRADLKSWRKIREITVRELETIYKRLGIQFDNYHWESDYNGGAIKHVMAMLEEKKLLTTDILGKKVAKFNDKEITILKSDNSTLYISRDVAALIERYKTYKFDEMLYVVDNSQRDHFAAVFNIVGQVNEKITNGCKHIKFGRIKGMSTRSGNVVFLNDILDEAKNKMYEKQKQSKNTRDSAMNEETCDVLGTTAVIINDLKQRRLRDYNFEWDRALQSEGDTGIKLQYLHCRLWSLEQNCGVKIPSFCDPKYLPEEIVGLVIADLAKFDGILYKSHIEYEACIIVNYMFHLARNVNRMFKELNVKNVSNDLAEQRLLVFHSARLVLKTGLEIVGVKPLYEM